MMPPERKMMVENSTAAVAVAVSQQAHAREQEGDDHGGEDFEEAFDPEVHHPPAPVLGHGQVASAGPTSGRRRRTGAMAAEAIRNSASRCRFSPGLREGRPAAPGPSGPARGTGRRTGRSARSGRGRRIRSPGGRTRSSSTKPSFCCTPSHCAGQRADHDDQQADEQEVHARALELRLVAGDGRGDEQARGQPGGGDPEDAELRVPGAGHGVGQPLGQRECRRSRRPRRRSGR